MTLDADVGRSPIELLHLAARLREANVVTQAEALHGSSEPRRLPVPSVLPRVFHGLAARLLGTTEEQIQARLTSREEDEPLDGIRRDLGAVHPGHPEAARLAKDGFRPEDLVLTSIPVLPRAPPPPPFGPPMPDDAGWTLESARMRAARIARLKELAAPSIIVQNELIILHDAVDRFLDPTFRSERSYWVYDPRVQSYRPAEGADFLPTAPEGPAVNWWRRERANPVLPEEVALLGDSIVVVFPFALAHLSVDGEVRALIPMASCEVVGQSDDDRFLLLINQATTPRVHIYDVLDGRFVVGEWPSGLVGRAFLTGPEKSGTSLMNLRPGLPVSWAASPFLDEDAIAAPHGHIAYSPEGELAWPCLTPGSEIVGIIDMVHGRALARAGAVVMTSRSRPAPPGEAIPERGVGGTRCRALSRLPDSRIRIFYRGRVLDQGAEVAKVAVPKGAAVRFGRGGTRLLAASSKSLTIHEIPVSGSEGGSRKLDLRPLHADLSLDEASSRVLEQASKGSEATAYDLLRNFGTREAIAASTAPEIVRRVTETERELFKEAPSLSRARAKTLLESLRKGPPPVRTIPIKR